MQDAVTNIHLPTFFLEPVRMSIKEELSNSFFEIESITAYDLL